jgi:hypothetical protein
MIKNSFVITRGVAFILYPYNLAHSKQSQLAPEAAIITLKGLNHNDLVLRVDAYVCLACCFVRVNFSLRDDK